MEIGLQQDGCVYLKVVVHELLHSLGFKHEQNRPDRDTFVTVNLDHSGLNSAENEIVEVVLAESVTTALIN